MIKDSFKYGFILKVLKISIHHFFWNDWFKKWLIFQKCWFKNSIGGTRLARWTYVTDVCLVSWWSDNPLVPIDHWKINIKFVSLTKSLFWFSSPAWICSCSSKSHYVIDSRTISDYYVTDHYISYDFRFRSKTYHSITVTKYYDVVFKFCCYVILMT